MNLETKILFDVFATLNSIESTDGKNSLINGRVIPFELMFWREDLAFAMSDNTKAWLVEVNLNLEEATSLLEILQNISLPSGIFKITREEAIGLNND